MRWTPNGLSKNFEDRRNEPPVEPLPVKDDRVMAHEPPLQRPAMQVRFVGEREGVLEYEDGHGNRFAVPRSVVGTGGSGVALGPSKEQAPTPQADIEKYQREFEAAPPAPEPTPMALPDEDDDHVKAVSELRRKLGLL